MGKPRFPIYIPSKGRADSRLTAKALSALGVPYRMVVEQQEWPDYVKHEPAKNLLILDPSYQEKYDDLIHLLGAARTATHTRSKGSGPARNFLWEHSIGEGHTHHWIMDDNIRYFGRLHGNDRIRAKTGAIFHAMEEFMLRYENLAMCGPQYEMFCLDTTGKMKPFALNTRLFSCILIRNDIPFRWRGRYNEDAILSLDVLKGGWCTVQFNAFFQKKMTTQTMKGGNAEIYAKGTLDKSRMLVAAHPDVARLATRYGRDHHHVNWNRLYKDRKLRLHPGLQKPRGVVEFGMKYQPAPTR